MYLRLAFKGFGLKYTGTGIIKSDGKKSTGGAFSSKTIFMAQSVTTVVWSTSIGGGGVKYVLEGFI